MEDSPATAPAGPVSDRPPPLVPSATVLLARNATAARNTTAGIEVLLVHRAAHLGVHGGAWAFPGGRIEADDFAVCGGDDIESAAMAAAVRETREETAIDLAGARLVPFAHWTAPHDAARRFATWFFLAAAPSDEVVEVVVDGTETQGHRWFIPSDAVAARNCGEIELAAPTFVSLVWLTSTPTVAAALTGAGRPPFTWMTPRSVEVADGFVSLYGGDVAFDDVNRLHDSGPRHRLSMVADGWHYERTPEAANRGG